MPKKVPPPTIPRLKAREPQQPRASHIFRWNGHNMGDGWGWDIIHAILDHPNYRMFSGRALGGGIPGRISNDLNGTNLLVPNLSPSIGGICKMHDVASRRGAVHVLFHSQHQTEVLDDFWMYRSCSCMTLPGAIFKVPCMHCQYAEVYGMNILVACLEKLSVAVAFLHEIDIQELGYSWDWLDCWRLTFSAAILSQGLSDSHQTKDYSPCGASPRPG